MIQVNAILRETGSFIEDHRAVVIGCVAMDAPSPVDLLTLMTHEALDYITHIYESAWEVQPEEALTFYGMMKHDPELALLVVGQSHDEEFDSNHVYNIWSSVCGFKEERYPYLKYVVKPISDQFLRDAGCVVVRDGE